MAEIVVVAEYRDEPSEGMQVISKTLIDSMMQAGHSTCIIEPSSVLKSLPLLIRKQPAALVFTHGPGVRVLAVSWIMRRLSRARIIWVASRPDLGTLPVWMRLRKTAHSIVCNRRRPDLERFAGDADYIEQFIGIDPARVSGPVAPTSSSSDSPWPDISATGRPVVLHVGHLRRNRGLELLATAKRALGDEIEVIVQGSPALYSDAEVIEDLLSAGVAVRRTYEPDLHRLYKATNLYVFPVHEASAGAIELPLGVLEAVACGIPVLSTNFGVLDKALAGVPGVTFFDHEDFLTVLRTLLDTGLDEKPDGLPPHLHADRTAETVLQILEALRCAA